MNIFDVLIVKFGKINNALERNILDQENGNANIINIIQKAYNESLSDGQLKQTKYEHKLTICDELCPICLDIIQSPLILCANKHMICNQCFQISQASQPLKNCPVCRQPLISCSVCKTYGLYASSENVKTNLCIKCFFSRIGYFKGDSLYLETLANHVVVTEIRKYKCPICRQSMEGRDVFDTHFHNEHSKSYKCNQCKKEFNVYFIHKCKAHLNQTKQRRKESNDTQNTQPDE